jgi:serine/threonine-protein kinase
METSEIRDQLQRTVAERYRLGRELGRGGMATVYLAEDLRHRRSVAVKVLRPDLGEGISAERFLREIEITAQLLHPHILTLIDSGEADGLLYYVMPYVEGESLRERLDREGELPVGDGTRILREVVDALAYAHGRGIVHRDIKPENVLLSGSHALVADFGVAKAVATASGPTARHVMAAQLTRAPEPLAKLRPSLPAALEQLVMRCLEKRPADRWQSAEELLRRPDGP